MPQRLACALLHNHARADAIALQGENPSRYSESNRFMRWSLAACLVGVLAASAAPLSADVRTEAQAQVAFGIEVARRGLWREAIYRWERAVQIDPAYAQAYNDLGVAYEHEGQLEKARKAYEKALELEPKNTQIRQNYDLFKEINDRASAATREKP